jgi:hypothetical protein
LEDYPDAFNILLVDSEAAVNKPPWDHLKSRDNWDSPSVDDTHCHLMVQAMEAWFIADIDTLKKFYGQGFRENSIPRNPNVEKIDKDSLEPSLKEATRNTVKGEYQKIQHASKLLELLNVAKVREASWKNSITYRPCRLHVCTTLSKSAVCWNRFIEREPPLTLRLVTAKRRSRSAKLLSGGTCGWS